MPQAWAAGSAFMLMQAILGFLPDAPRGSFMSTRCCRLGCPTWLRTTLVSADTNSISDFGGKAGRPYSR